eukprot:9574803-Karenia_brevis.AAC.1
MATLEERVNELNANFNTSVTNLEKWRGEVAAHFAMTDSKVATNESNIAWLINQFEQMSRKDKDGQKGLRKAFGSKGADLKPEKFEKEKPGMTF